MAKSPQKSELAALFDAASQAPQRLAKRIASAGLCSRRDAEQWITDGRVKVDGTRQDSPAINVTSEQVITVDSNPLPVIEPPRLWRYYKPRGLVVSHRDEKDRMTIFDAIRESHGDSLPRMISVGRLDLDSEGLILLTNSGALARYLELPSTGWIRKYRARVRGQVKKDHLDQLGRGLTVDGVRYRPVVASLDHQANSNAWLNIALKEGKNREIRKLMEHFGYPVSRLIRTSFGPFMLSRMDEGDIAEVKAAVLRDQLGLKKAEKDAEADTTKPRGKSQTRTPSSPKKSSHSKRLATKDSLKKPNHHANHQRKKTRRDTNRP
jgi:23S rRNA pseudouridine2605 synthase